jgi:hypothetical protein
MTANRSRAEPLPTTGPTARTIALALRYGFPLLCSRYRGVEQFTYKAFCAIEVLKEELHMMFRATYNGRFRKGETMTRIAAAAFVFAALMAGACNKNESKTTAPATWRNPDFSGGALNALFVIGVGRDDEHRKIYENQMVAALQREGLIAQASWGLFPESEPLGAEDVLQAVGEGRFDGIVLTRLLSADEQLEFVTGQPQHVPASNRHGYMFDYEQSYAAVHEAEYYRADVTYNLEATIYAASDGTKVWAARSEALDPYTVNEVAKSATRLLTRKMKADGLIR